MKDAGSGDVRYDCLVIGGGPAGLTAAIYLARFHLSVLVVESGESRAELIPLTRNHAGFPEGISGSALLSRMREQAGLYGTQLRSARVEALLLQPDGFEAIFGSAAVRARTVLLATGVVNRRPTMIGAAEHARALAEGRLRYCPICDGYEVTDKRIAVLGTGERGHNEALFLRGYTKDIWLVAPEGGHELSDEQRNALLAAGVQIVGVCDAAALDEDGLRLDIEGASIRVDSLYPALGSDIRSELAARSAPRCPTRDA